MKTIFYFSEEQKIIQGNQIIPYQNNMLKNIIKQSTELYFVTCPGSYTGIRRSISIAKAIKIYADIPIYGINLISQLGPLITNKNILFKDKSIPYFFNQSTKKISITKEWNNFEEHNFELYNEKLITMLEEIPKIPIKIEYYDKFSN